ncbi:hypothetical protein NLO413_0979 [Candidatus Neoehrlichia lotoris str. RAC413]|uniref:Uncharacterized protein n=1 Tax=Candidatus Neoehrlichia procyonis str. RAC413 TaxID=1359163 RepID=A0A0F3NRT2_9RICK|nr:hypothetical protein NLO413_0979 [Candidatus Neoehrlichia lotoris str. RAC413]
MLLYEINFKVNNDRIYIDYNIDVNGKVVIFILVVYIIIGFY